MSYNYVCFVLDSHAGVLLYEHTETKFRTSHFYYILLLTAVCLEEKLQKTNLIVFDLTRLGTEPTFYTTHREQ